MPTTTNKDAHKIPWCCRMLRRTAAQDGKPTRTHAHAHPTHSTPFRDRPEAAVHGSPAPTAASAAVSRPCHHGPERLPALGTGPSWGKRRKEPQGRRDGRRRCRERTALYPTEAVPSLPCREAPHQAPGEEETGSDSKLQVLDPKYGRARPRLGPSVPAPGGPQTLSSHHIPPPRRQTTSCLHHCTGLTATGPSCRRLGALVGESPLFTRPQNRPPVSPGTTPGAALVR